METALWSLTSRFPLKERINGASLVRGGPRLSRETLEKMSQNLSSLSFFQRGYFFDFAIANTAGMLG